MRKKVKCILLSPHFDYVKGSIYHEISSLDPPLGLISLSSFLNEAGIETMVFDLNVEIKNNNELPDFAQKIKNIYTLEQPVFGISFLTPYVHNSYETARVIKSIFPESIIIAGGTHATFMADEILNAGPIDIVVRGEGEYTLLDILSGKSPEIIDGISYKSIHNNSINIIHNKDRERIADINTLPMPAYYQLKMHRYRPILGSYKKLPAANIITTRGCNGTCNFCCKSLGKKITYKSPETIVSEIKYLIKNYKIKHINIYDDTFTINKKRVENFCDLMISERVSVDWTCFARIDNMDEALLKKMKKAGCYQIMYGVENFDQGILDSLSKNISVNKIEEIIELTKKTGIVTRVSLMLGNPKDTWDTFNNNIRALKRIKPDIIVVSIFTPIPGSELYQWALENNRLLTKDWSKFAGNNSVLKLDYLSSEEVTKQYRKIYSYYYYTPLYIWERFKRIETLTQFWMYIKAFFYILRFIFTRK